MNRWSKTRCHLFWYMDIFPSIYFWGERGLQPADGGRKSQGLYTDWLPPYVGESWTWMIWKAAVKRNPPSGQNCEQCACLFTLNGGRDGLYLDSCVVTMDSLVDQGPRRSKIGRLETHGGMWRDLLAWAQACKSMLLTLMPRKEESLNNLAEVLSPWSGSLLSHSWACAMDP